MDAGTLLQGCHRLICPPYIASGLPCLSISPHVVFAEVLILERKGPNTRQVPMQLYGYISAKIKRIDCFLECASFIGCQANKALVAETSAHPTNWKGKNVTEKRGMEIRKQAGSRLKSHQVYADSNGILWPGMLPRHLLSLEPFFLKLDT